MKFRMTGETNPVVPVLPELPFALRRTDDVKERFSIQFGRRTVTSHLAAEVDLNRDPASGNPPMYSYMVGLGGSPNSWAADSYLVADSLEDIAAIPHCLAYCPRMAILPGKLDSLGNEIQTNTVEQRARFLEVLAGVYDSDLDRVLDPIIGWANDNPTKPVWWSLGKECSGDFRPDWPGKNVDLFVEAFRYVADRARARGAGANCIFGLDSTTRWYLSAPEFTNPFTQIYDPLRLSGHLQALFIDVYDNYALAAFGDHLDDDPALFVFPGLNLHSEAQRANTWKDPQEAFDYYWQNRPESAKFMFEYALQHRLYIGFPEIGFYYGNSDLRMRLGGQTNLALIELMHAQVATAHAAGLLSYHMWFLSSAGGVGFKAWEDPIAKAALIAKYGY